MLILTILVALFLAALAAGSLWGMVLLAQKRQWIWLGVAVLLFPWAGFSGYLVEAKPGAEAF